MLIRLLSGLLCLVALHSLGQRTFAVQRSMEIAAAGSSFDAGIIELLEVEKGITQVKLEIDISYGGSAPQKVTALANDNATKVQVVKNPNSNTWRLTILKTVPVKRKLIEDVWDCVELYEDQRKGSLCYRAVLIFKGVEIVDSEVGKRRFVGLHKNGFSVAVDQSKANSTEYSFGWSDTLGKQDLGVWNYYSKGSVETQMKTRTVELTCRVFDWEEVFKKELHSDDRGSRFFDLMSRIDSISGWEKGKKVNVYFERNRNKSFYRIYPSYESDSLIIYSGGSKNTYFLYPGEPGTNERDIEITKGGYFEIKNGRSYNDLFFIKDQYLLFVKGRNGNALSSEALANLLGLLKVQFPQNDFLIEGSNIVVFLRDKSSVPFFYKKITELEEVKYCFTPVIQPSMPIAKYVSPRVEVMLKQGVNKMDVKSLYSFKDFELLPDLATRGSIIISHKGKIMDEDFWKSLQILTKEDAVETIFLDYSLSPE